MTIKWGLPTEGDHFFNSLDADEWRTLDRVIEYRPLTPYLVFGDFDHPIVTHMFHFYVKELAEFFHLLQWDNSYAGFWSHPLELTRFFILGRTLNVIFALWAIVLCYTTAKRVFSRQVGLLAAGILAILPVHVLQTQIAKYNSFGTTLNLALFSLALSLRRTNASQLYFWCGVTLGCAVSTTSFQGLGAIWLLISAEWLKLHSRHLMRRFSHLLSPRMLLLYVTAVLTILILNHWIIFSFSSWWADVHDLADSFGGDKVYNNNFICKGWPGVIYTLKYLQPFAFGLPLAWLFWPALLYSCFKRSDADWMITPLLLMTYIVFFGSTFKYTRSIMHSTPLSAIIIARFLIDLLCYLRKNQRLFWISAVSIVICMLLTVGQNILFASLLWQRDTHLKASEWVTAAIRPGSTIGLLHEYWEYHPPVLSPDYHAGHELPYHLVQLERRDYHALLESKIEYLITSDMELYGLYHKYAKFPERYPLEADFLHNLVSLHDFTEVYRVKNRVPLLDSLINHPMIPLDLMMYNVEIIIFQRVSR